MASRSIVTSGSWLLGLAGLAYLSLSGSATGAEDRAAPEDTVLAAQFQITLAGFQVGKAFMTADYSGEDYKIDAHGRTTGLSRIISNGRARIISTGHLGPSRPVPETYALNSKDSIQNIVQMALNRGNVAKLAVQPALKQAKTRVPVKARHRRNVIDPLSALLFPAKTESRLVPQECERTLPIFDGRLRFNIRMSYKRSAEVKTRDEGSYRGKVLVCQVRFEPIAGHRADKLDVTRLKDHTGIEVWLAPLGNTPMLGAYKVTIATKYGELAVAPVHYQLGPKMLQTAARD